MGIRNYIITWLEAFVELMQKEVREAEEANRLKKDEHSRHQKHH